MKLVKVRSPFIIDIGGYGSTHTGSKIILTIWNKETTEPTSGTGYYELSKTNPSAIQKETYYNVSNYVREFIENIKPTKIASSPSYEDNNEWVNFRVRKSWYNGTTYTEISNVLYVGVNGFTNYTQGVNAIVDNSTTGFLSNNLISKNILKSSLSLKNYINWMGEFASGYSVNIVYTNLSNTYNTTQTVSGLSGIYNFKIPLTLHPTNVNFEDGCKLTVNFYNGATLLNSDIVFVNSIEECKYTPVECTFINRYGGWEFLTFFKAQSNTVTSKGTDYKLTQANINYNPSIGQFKTFNLNGKQTIKLNTGFVDDNYSELITDLLLSETVLLDGKPVTVKTQGSELKTSLKDKLINYEMEFEYAYNLINDVV
jgi:hypothetical protein